MEGTGSPAVDRLVVATNAHDVDAMLACLHDDYRSEQPLHPEAGFSGREQVGRNWSLMFAEVPDLRFDVLRSATAGDEVWTEIRVHGRKADGDPFEYRGMTVWGVRDDRVAWARFYFEPVEVGGGGIQERMQRVLGTDP
jgi:ketosteroid isomerase-like protein